MSITTSPRFGLTQWSAESDPVNRTQFETSFGLIDSLGALYSQGALSARPAYGTVGRFYFATDTGLLYYDTGAAWVTINPATPLGTSATVSAVGDSENGGSTGLFSDAGHKHGREAFGGSGSAATVAHSDHTHAVTAKAEMWKSDATIAFISSGTSDTPVTGYTIQHDPGGNCSSSAGTFTCPVAGTYFIEASGAYNASSGANGECFLALYVNGTNTRGWQQPTTNGITTVQGNPIITLAAGAVLTLGAGSSSSTGVNFGNCRFNVSLISSP